MRRLRFLFVRVNMSVGICGRPADKVHLLRAMVRCVSGTNVDKSVEWLDSMHPYLAPTETKTFRILESG